MTLFQRLFQSLPADRLSRQALIAGPRSWSYGQLRDAVESAARLLQSAGVSAGDRVQMVLPNSPEFVVAFFGLTRLGAIAVPVDFQAGPERLRFIAEDTRPLLCLGRPARGLPEDFPVPGASLTIGSGTGAVELDPAPRTGPEVLPEVNGEADAVILFSAGSTGRPKGALLKHRHLLRIARTLVGVIGMDAGHRDLILSPMTHSGGWQRVTSTLMAGGTVVLPEGPLSVPALLEDVLSQRIRGFFAAPPLLRALMAADAERVRRATGSLRSIESASAPLAPEELARLMDLLPRTEVYFQYGLTECSRAFILDARAHPDKLHTVGLATPGVEARITSPDGDPLPPGSQGEIQLAAEQRTERYWNRPDLNDERFVGRWLRTGDVGSLDGEGFLSYHGRRDDMINCGGLSYFPAEVERELGPVDGVAEYIVAGVPDPRGIYEHVPWVFVVPEDADHWESSGLMKAARHRLPPHMLPRRVVVLTSMPLIASGKPDRRTVVARHGPGSS